MKYIMFQNLKVISFPKSFLSLVCFKVFDVDRDGVLSRVELKDMVVALLEVWKDNRTDEIPVSSLCSLIDFWDGALMLLRQCVPCPAKFWLFTRKMEWMFEKKFLKSIIFYIWGIKNYTHYSLWFLFKGITYGSVGHCRRHIECTWYHKGETSYE